MKALKSFARLIAFRERYKKARLSSRTFSSSEEALGGAPDRNDYWQRIFWLLMVTIVPGLQVGALIVLTGPIGLNGAVAIAPAVAAAPPATAPAVRAAPATGPAGLEVSC